MFKHRATRTITLEEHFSTPEFLKATIKDAAAVPEFIRQMQAKLLDFGPGRIADMDAAGIDLQVLSLAAAGLNELELTIATALARDTNDVLAAIVRAHPDRYAAFGAVAAQEPEKAAAEFERCVRELGFKGIMLNGTTGGMFLDNPRFTPLFEAAQRLDSPIYLHPGPPPRPVREAYYQGLPGHLGLRLATAAWGWHTECGMHCLRMIFSGLFDRFSQLKIIIGHMGEDLPFSIVRAADMAGQHAKHLKRRITEYFQEHFYITTSGYFTIPPFLCALQVVGADRILFSVDYPFSANASGREFLNTLPVSGDDFEKIAHGNAERLLKL